MTLASAVSAIAKHTACVELCGLQDAGEYGCLDASQPGSFSPAVAVGEQFRGCRGLGRQGVLLGTLGAFPVDGAHQGAQDLWWRASCDRPFGRA